MDAFTLEVMRIAFCNYRRDGSSINSDRPIPTNIKIEEIVSCALFDVNGETISQAEHITCSFRIVALGVK